MGFWSEMGMYQMDSFGKQKIFCGSKMVYTRSFRSDPNLSREICINCSENK